MNPQDQPGKPPCDRPGSDSQASARSARTAAMGTPSGLRRKRPANRPDAPPAPSSAEYVELHAHSQHSLRDSAAHAEDLVVRAAALGMTALGITDHDSMAVAPEFRAAAMAAGIKPVQGSEVSFEGHAGGAFHLTLLAEDEGGYANICAVLSRARGIGAGREEAETLRKNPSASIEMLEGRTGGVLCLTGCAKGELAHHLLRRDEGNARRTLGRWVDLFGPDNVFVELQDHQRGFEPGLNRALCEMADRFGLPVVATNNVHTIVREDFWVHEAMACWRAGRLSRSAVFPDRPRSAEVYLKGADEMARLFRPRPDALKNTLAIAERCRPVLDPSVRRWPDFTELPPGHTEETYLDHLTGIGARRRYGRAMPEHVRRRIQYELRLIRDKGFPGYFLILWLVCRWMRSEGILYRIRGSAGGSVVAYCLWISTIDPFAFGLSFDRFLNEARNAPPDIDLDIDSRERDRVVAHLREVYGRERVASVAAYSTIRGKSLIRDFGPVFDLPPDAIDIASKSLRNVTAHQLGEAFEGLPQLRDSGLPKAPFEPLIEIGRKISRFPSHNMTTVGVVLAGKPLTEVSPLWPAAKDGEAAVSYDKDWVERVGLIKTDFLFLRELAAIRDSVRSILGLSPPPPSLGGQGEPDGLGFDQPHSVSPFPASAASGPGKGARGIGQMDAFYDGIPLDDPDTYALLASGRTIGVFQLESPAQRVLMQRMRPNCLKDCVAAVALIRPGPITGDAVTPFVRRHNGLEEVPYPDERLRPVLEHTYGVVVYQDQVIDLAMAAAGWGPDRADTLRRRISHARSMDRMREIETEFVAAVIANGMDEHVAAWCFRSIVGFASYGFCHAHAAAFGETAYKSAYLLAHHPAHYLMGVMNNFPMAYYPLRTVVAEARRRGIRVLGPDVNRSATDDRANDTTIRAGLKHVRGLKERTLEAIAAARTERPFRSVPEFCERVPASRDEVESLALAGAFSALHPNRKSILRAAERLAGEGAARRALGRSLISDTALPRVRDFNPYERSLKELEALGFCVGPDPVSFHRATLRRAGVVTCAEAMERRGGHHALVAGWRTRPHTPPIKSGKTIAFFTLEDETDTIDVTVFPDAYMTFGRTIFMETMVVVSGTMEDRDGALCLIAESIRPLREVLSAAREMEAALPPLADVSFAEAGWTLAAW